jgi:hypothetical protein
LHQGLQSGLLGGHDLFHLRPLRIGQIQAVKAHSGAAEAFAARTARATLLRHRGRRQ